uniref:Uncharacterized protein n=1 Tax=Arundo donax TaxID=35708 RepID=A0A0A9AJ79_ARUDO
MTSVGTRHQILSMLISPLGLGLATARTCAIHATTKLALAMICMLFCRPFSPSTQSMPKMIST